MRTLPLEDPGTPDARSPARYLWWIIRGQRGTVAAGVLFGVLWMASQAFVPAAIGNAIDGVAEKDTGRLLIWTGAVLGLGAVTAVAGILRHRMAVFNWLCAAYRTVQVAVRHTTKVGAALPRKISTGEVVSIGATDISHIGGAIEITARAAGAVVAFVIVAAILLTSSVTLGVIVLAGVPVLMLAISPLFGSLHRRQHTYRDIGGRLTTRATDIVAGLRVLRGIGGEESFSGRFKEESQRLRRAGLQVAKVDAALDGAQVLLPGVFVTIVTWLGAKFALAGDISVGELVAFYGYAAFLVQPLRTATEAAHKIIRGLVAARRVTRLLALKPAVGDPERAALAPVAEARDNEDSDQRADGPELVDAESGLSVGAGTLTAVAATDPEDAAPSRTGSGAMSTRMSSGVAFRSTGSWWPPSGNTSSSRTARRGCSRAGSATSSMSGNQQAVLRSRRHFVLPLPKTSSTVSRTGWMRSSRSAAARSPADSASACCSLARCSPTRTCSSSPSRHRRWTPIPKRESRPG